MVTAAIRTHNSDMSDDSGAQQLPLHLPLHAAQAKEDLVVTAANERAVRFLESWPDWPSRIVVLAGPTGAGKTHLAHIWAKQANAEFLVPPVDKTTPAQPTAPVVLEDLQTGLFDETWLFHLLNTVRATDTQILITSRDWPGDWGMSLPDLKSRVMLATLLELQEPDDELLRGVLVKLFADRQMQIDRAVIDYLAIRMERSLDFARTLVERLDARSLSQQRAVTRPLAAEVLRELGLQD